jgi:hypothetical protein
MNVEIERLRTLLREAADLIRDEHGPHGTPQVMYCMACIDEESRCGGDYPCRYEQLRRRIEEALNA